MMKKKLSIIIASMAVLSTVGLSVGITYAASYKAPEETTTYEFGAMSPSSYNFQSLAYYFAGGSGTDGSPFLVKNSTHLRNLSKLQNSGAFPDGLYVSLASSFQYEGAAMEPIGTYKYPFTGVFNGQSYLITGLKVETSIVESVNSVNTAYVGMFGVVGNTDATGTIHSLVLAGPEIIYSGTATTVKLGIVAGMKDTTHSPNHSVVENIQIYGGKSNAFSNMRAHVRSSVAVTIGDSIVGIGGSSTSGFVNTLSSTPTYADDPKFGSNLVAGTNYYLWNYNGTVISGDSPA